MALGPAQVRARGGPRAKGARRGPREGPARARGGRGARGARPWTRLSLGHNPHSSNPV